MKIKKLGKIAFIIIFIFSFIFFICGLISLWVFLDDFQFNKDNFNNTKKYLIGAVFFIAISIFNFIKALKDKNKLGYFKKEDKNSENS